MKQIESVLKPQLPFANMGVLIKEQGQKPLTGQHSHPQKAAKPQSYTREWTDPRGAPMSGGPHIHESLWNFLWSTFWYCLCLHLTDTAKASLGLTTLFLLLVPFIHSTSVYSGYCVSPGAELWKDKDEGGINLILSTLSIITSFPGRTARWNW